jgi:hypothetical protein
MKKISEVGHSKNVANLEDLISYCTNYGNAYNPSLASLQLVSLTNLKTTANAAINTVTNAITNYKTAVNNRRIAFINLNQLAPRIISALKASGINKQTLVNATSIYKKLMGRNNKLSVINAGKQTAVIANAMATAKSISTSQQSFDSKLDFFAALLDLVSNISNYTPNEPNLSVAGLTSFLANLKNTNTAVINTTMLLDAARVSRNHLLYDDVTGLVEITSEVKNYVASIYGKNSSEFKQLNKIKFTILK